MTVASCYGFPVSHEHRRLNEAFLKDVLSYMGKLNSLAVVIGDLNDHPCSSPVLASATILDMHRITDDTPTTFSKSGTVSARQPLDHCLVNRQALQIGIRVKIDPTLILSDHLPILLEFARPAFRFLSVSWSSPPSLKPKQYNPAWTCTPCDFWQWQEQARMWIQQAHQQPIQPKGCFTYQDWEAKAPAKHVTFRRLLTLQKAVVELDLYPRNPSQSKSVVRKLRALGMGCLEACMHDTRVLRNKVQDKVQTYMKKHHRSCLRKWRDASKQWKLSDVHVYRYLRNATPTKVSAVLVNQEPCVHPWTMQQGLLDYWSKLEHWTQEQREQALEVLEDKYSIFLTTSTL